MPDLVELTFLVIVFGAYFVGAVLGFGTTILAVTFGALLVPMEVVLPVVAPLNIGLGAYIALRYRRYTQWRILLRRALPLAALGLPFGLMLFNLRQSEWLKLGFGLFVIVLAVLQLRLSFRASEPAAESVPLSKPIGGSMLWLAGVVHGLWATPGPLIVYVLGRELPDKGAFRSTISTLFIPLTTALMVDYAVTGLFTPQAIRLSSLAVVPVLLGLVLGEWAHRKMESRTFLNGVWLLLLAGGLLLSIRAYLAA
jgi:uncharacterized membrane protein YfcA